jgi:hypothetical protein
LTGSGVEQCGASAALSAPSVRSSRVCDGVRAVTVLSAFTLRNEIAEGLVRVKMFWPRVVPPRVVSMAPAEESSSRFLAVLVKVAREAVPDPVK